MFQNKWILSYTTGETSKLSELENRHRNTRKCCKELILNCLSLFGIRDSNRYTTGETSKLSELKNRHRNTRKCCKELILNCLSLFGIRVSSRYS
jgi:hypothetical protein